ncbi:MAG: hypothetical protein K9K66_17015 [Desulfarculaceae bacterium]|nr:hypothetical protein [Desulfarculaceae bacterium]MCF8074293.1 hypothetical protein [Desulfarculaceae bacterium]MCF8103361.1 hypothetical protein [Desulfarculaceae bacterium]MCF8117849.1 hypothetical protein [Desulfarculaceae bacterium]
MFRAFVGCQKYQRTRSWDYYAAKRSPGGGQRIAGGPYARGVAIALANFYRAWCPRW